MDDAILEGSVDEKRRFEAIVRPEIVKARSHDGELHSRSGNEAFGGVVSVERLPRRQVDDLDANGATETKASAQLIESLRQRIVEIVGGNKNWECKEQCEAG